MLVFLSFMIPRPPRSPLFPYTTLFRSQPRRGSMTKSLIAIAAAVFLTAAPALAQSRSEEHTSELQSRVDLVCRLLLEKKKHSERRRAGLCVQDASLSAGRDRGCP